MFQSAFPKFFFYEVYPHLLSLASLFFVGANKICFQVASLSRTQTIMGTTSLLDSLTPKKPVLTFVPQLMVDFSGRGDQEIGSVG